MRKYYIGEVILGYQTNHRYVNVEVDGAVKREIFIFSFVVLLNRFAFPLETKSKRVFPLCVQSFHVYYSFFSISTQILQS